MIGFSNTKVKIIFGFADFFFVLIFLINKLKVEQPKVSSIKIQF